MGLELLEARVLLSVVIVANMKSATYSKPDDDLVTIVVTKGTLTEGMFTTKASGPEDQLEEIKLIRRRHSG